MKNQSLYFENVPFFVLRQLIRSALKGRKSQKSSIFEVTYNSMRTYATKEKEPHYNFYVENLDDVHYNETRQIFLRYKRSFARSKNF